MKKQVLPKKRLQLSTETVRELKLSQLGEIAGASNNGCGSLTSVQPTGCRACVN